MREAIAIATVRPFEPGQIFWASGSKGDCVRGDGNGTFMKRGYYYKRPGFALGFVVAGPFKTKTAAKDSLLRDLGVSF